MFNKLNRRILFILSFSFLTFLSCQNNIVYGQNKSADFANGFVKGEVIVKFKDHAPQPQLLPEKKNAGESLDKGEIYLNSLQPLTVPSSLLKINQKHTVKSLEKIVKKPSEKTKPDLLKIYKVNFDENTDVKQVVKELNSENDVVYAEPNYIGYPVWQPNDPYISLQWPLNKIGMEQAWDISRGKNVVVAVLDTGFDINHSELTGKLLPGFSYTDDTSDVSDNVDQPCAHATFVSGIIGANTNNSSGIAGIAPESLILPVKVMERYVSGMGCYGAYSDFARGIIYSADHQAQIINMSFGGVNYSFALTDAVDYANARGVFMIAAAGNNNSSAPFYPAYYDNVVAVAGTDSQDQRHSNSNFGNWIDVSAPAVSVYSILPNETYSYWTGTSFASPHVAGLAALILAKEPNLIGQPQLIKNIILENSVDLGNPGQDQYFGAGRIDAYKTLNQLVASPIPTITLLSKVMTQPSSINAILYRVPQTIGISALAYDSNNNPIWSGASYEWGISSTNSIGTLTRIYSDITEFVPQNAGTGDIFVTARLGAQSATSSIPVVVNPPSGGKPGDVNGDGKVNISDLGILLSNFGKTTSTGDVNGDGKVNISDLGILLSNFGT